MPEIADRIGRYEIVGELGRGGMARVYLARQVDLDRMVALKQLINEREDEGLASRFIRESRLAGSLAHPNILTVFEFLEFEGLAYIAMELMPRGSLRPYVRHGLTLAQRGGVLADTLAGLAYAERHEVVHRDLKPENLLVTAEGHLKIADFGIAKAARSVHSRDFRTDTGTTMGTPGYMAPEQAMGQPVGPWSDLYSVGCLAYELFTGSIPFADTDAPMAMLLRHISEPIPAATSVRSDVPPAVGEWIHRLLEKRPEQRTRAAADALEDLEELMLGLVGPRWRRDAALTEQAQSGTLGAPWTPPPADARERTVDYQSYIPRTSTRDDADAADAPSPHEDQGGERGARATPAGKAADAPRLGGRALAVAAVVIVLTACGVGVATVVGEDQPVPPSTPGAAVKVAPGPELAAGPLSLLTPAGWKTVAAPALAGVELSSVTAAAPGGDTDQGFALLGVAPEGTSKPTLLPVALQKALEDVPEPSTKTLNGTPVYGYSDLRPEGLSGTLNLYVASTRTGVAVLACAVPPTAVESGFAAACEKAAGDLRVDGALAPGPSAEYARGIDDALAPIAKSLRAQHRALRRSTRDESRYRGAAESLGQAFAVAAGALESVVTSPAEDMAHARLVESVSRASARYRTLARDARRSRPERSQTAARAAASAERAVAKALTGLLESGYEDLINTSLRTESVPALKRKPKARPRSQTSSPATAEPPTSAVSRPEPVATVKPRNPTNPTVPQPRPTSDPRPKPTATARPPVTTDG